jgi:hypothetical protein
MVADAIAGAFGADNQTIFDSASIEHHGDGLHAVQKADAGIANIKIEAVGG